MRGFTKVFWPARLAKVHGGFDVGGAKLNLHLCANLQASSFKLGGGIGAVLVTPVEA